MAPVHEEMEPDLMDTSDWGALVAITAFGLWVLWKVVAG